jgi:hypothetical protein
MTKQISWSISALNAFETCPRRFYHTRVGRDVNDPPGEHALWGQQVHKAFELRLKNEAPLPAYLSTYEGMVTKIMSRPGKRLVEARLCVDANFQPTTWKNAWCRGVVDVGVLGTKAAFLADWKTGKQKPEQDQMELMAAMAFSHHPYLEEVTTTFVWLKDKKLDTHAYSKTRVGELWSKFLPRVKRLEKAHIDNNWPPKPSGLCGKYCPVTKTHCEFGRSAIKG